MLLFIIFDEWAPISDIFLEMTVAERPQHMLMRVAVGIHEEDIDAVIEASF